jgi:hypothetical protein
MKTQVDKAVLLWVLEQKSPRPEQKGITKSDWNIVIGTAAGLKNDPEWEAEIDGGFEQAGDFVVIGDEAAVLRVFNALNGDGK